MQIGNHKARATGDVQWGESANGNAQIAVQCVVEGGPCDGEAFWWVGNFASNESSKITIDGLRALGARLGNGDITDHEGLGSKVASASAKQETYQGEQRWRYSIGSGFGFKQQLDAGGLEALRQRMRGQLIHGSSKAAAAAPRREAPTRQVQDDDIPF
jgi:hypothetical protein